MADIGALRRLFRSLGNQTVGKPLSRAMEFRDLKADKRRKDISDAAHAERRARSIFSVNDPQPITEVSRLWRTAAQSATIGMFIILFVVALSLARPILWLRIRWSCSARTLANCWSMTSQRGFP